MSCMFCAWWLINIRKSYVFFYLRIQLRRCTFSDTLWWDQRLGVDVWDETYSQVLFLWDAIIMVGLVQEAPSHKHTTPEASVKVSAWFHLLPFNNTRVWRQITVRGSCGLMEEVVASSMHGYSMFSLCVYAIYIVWLTSKSTLFDVFALLVGPRWA